MSQVQWQAPIPQNEGAGGIPTLNPSALDVEKDPSDPSMYYRRRSDHPTQSNWIIMKSAQPANRAKFMKVGWVPLDEYGTFIHAQRSTDANGVAFDATREKWRVIFQRDGAKAFPLDQVIAYRWHARPPYKEVVFPQLEGVSVPQFDCPQCSWSHVEASYLKTHLEVAHAYTRTEIVAYSKDSGIVFERRTAKPEEVKAPVVLEMTSEPPSTLRCDQCDYETKTESKRPEQALRMHKRTHKLPALVGAS